MKFRSAALAVATMLACAGASAQVSGDVVRLGFVTDLSGVYSDMDGPAGAEAIRLAIEDFGGKVLGKKIELVTADHQNKPDIASARAREWIDRDGVDGIIGGVSSPAMLAIAHIAADKKRPFFVTAAVSTRLTNEECTPYTVHMAQDSTALANVAAAALIKQGAKNWYFLTVDNAGGIPMEEDAAKLLAANGGRKVGASRHPLGTADFSSFVLAAQSSKAQVLALANSGADTVNAIKTIREYGVQKNMKVAAMLVYLNEVNAVGLPLAQGLYVTESWYWDQSDASRAWAKRFLARTKRYPTAVHAADYSSALNYLKAVQAAGTDEGDAVMAKLKTMKVDDMFANGYVRADGRLMRDTYLMQVKSPKESKYAWDYYRKLQVVPADIAFTRKSDSRCSLWK